jgi:hypothetical protein
VAGEEMNYAKLDAALSSALSETGLAADEPRLLVSVRTVAPPDPAQQQELERLGVQGVSANERIFSARLSVHALSELSEKPWVRLVSLARLLKPLE